MNLFMEAFVVAFSLHFIYNKINENKETNGRRRKSHLFLLMLSKKRTLAYKIHACYKNIEST